ncbi:MAG: LuxR C-terminal-related transcriptional regulator [Trebonia sp.]
MRCILGLDQPTAGTVTIGGRPHRHAIAPMHEAGGSTRPRRASSGSRCSGSSSWWSSGRSRSRRSTAVMRDGLTQTLIRRGHDVLAAVADAEALTEAVAGLRPDVAVIDVRMPPTHTDEGLRAALAIRRDHPSAGTLVFSQYVETRVAADLLTVSPGGVGYPLKDRVADVGDFVEAISSVARGGTVLDPEVVRQLLAAGRHADSLASLTGREREVLVLVAEGRSNTAIAATLFISPGVVEKHVAGIFAKLGLAPSDSDNRRVLAAVRYLRGS